MNLDLIAEKVKTILDNMNLRLYDIQFNKVSKTLRVFIDRADSPVTIKDCEMVSNAISRDLDDSNIIDFSYTLEVSSPGIERPLNRPEHFKWALGKLIEVILSDNRLIGYIREARADGILLVLKSGEVFIPYHKILRAKMVEEFYNGKRR